MKRIMSCAALLLLASTAFAQTTLLSFDNDDFVVTPLFNNVPLFSFEIEIDAELAPGVYDNPPLVSVFYTVAGDLRNTPSGFPAFELERNIPGDEFYAQGSSIRFEVSQNAVLSDGVQVAELIGPEIVFTFDGREIDNGRFHPAIVELRANGTGRIQNSNNIVEDNPLQQVDFGEEYITDLAFDAGNLTLLTSINVPEPPLPTLSGSGSMSIFGLLTLLAVSLGTRAKRRQTAP